MIGEQIFLIPVEDGETVSILDYDVTFFDILSTKAKQFGFTMMLKNGKKFTCAGDEPYNPDCKPYVEGSQWLLQKLSVSTGTGNASNLMKNTTAR